MAEETEGASPSFLEIARDCISADQWRRIVQKAAEQAAEGDRYARDFIASFKLPKDRELQAEERVKEVRLIFEKVEGSE